MHGLYPCRTLKWRSSGQYVSLLESRRAFIDELKKHVPVHPITDTTAEIAGKFSGEQATKDITLPTDDLLIGASAIEQGYAAATLNIRHFRKIPGLQLLTL